MTGFLIGLAVTTIVVWLIVKKYQPHTVLLLAGLFLLAATAVLTLLSRAPQDGGAPEVQVPLTLRNRMLLMGKTPLLRVPEVVWPHG